MTAQHGREKAEEWLAVCQDFADDLLASHGEQAVEAFWTRIRLGVQEDSKLKNRGQRAFWEVMAPFVGADPGEFPKSFGDLLEMPNSASRSATRDT